MGVLDGRVAIVTGAGAGLGISRIGRTRKDVTDEDWHDSIAVMQTGVFYRTYPISGNLREFGFKHDRSHSRPHRRG